MKNIIFDRDSLNCVGLDRPAQPFEVEIKLDDKKYDSIKELTKNVPYNVTVNKEVLIQSEHGDSVEKELYLLPQEVKTIEETVTKVIETTEKTDTPKMFSSHIKTPLLDEKGKQVEYEVTAEGEVTFETDQPIMIQVEDEDGEVETIHKEDENGNKLYIGLVGTGVFNKCYTFEEKEVQATNEDDDLIYLKEIEEVVTYEEEQAPLEITDEHEDWSEDLEKATTEVEKYKTVKFSDSPDLFTYEDIFQFKQDNLHKDTFYGAATLIEQMSSIFSAQNNADVGFDFVTIKPEGVVITQPITLPHKEALVGLYVESTHEGLIFYVGKDEDSFVELSNRINEVVLDELTGEVVIKITNPTEKAIKLNAFGLLV